MKELYTKEIGGSLLVINLPILSQLAAQVG